MTDPKKAALQSYLSSLAYPAPSDQPQSTSPSATPRREQYLARLTPLSDRLRLALAKFPPEMMADGLHMNQLWGLAIGRQQSKPRAWEIAAALREIGWTRVRYYRDSEPSISLWFPPEVSVENAKQLLKGKIV